MGYRNNYRSVLAKNIRKIDKINSVKSLYEKVYFHARKLLHSAITKFTLNLIHFINRFFTASIFSSILILCILGIHFSPTI